MHRTTLEARRHVRGEVRRIRCDVPRQSPLDSVRAARRAAARTRHWPSARGRAVRAVLLCDNAPRPCTPTMHPAPPRLRLATERGCHRPGVTFLPLPSPTHAPRPVDSSRSSAREARRPLESLTVAARRGSRAHVELIAPIASKLRRVTTYVCAPRWAWRARRGGRQPRRSSS